MRINLGDKDFDTIKLFEDYISQIVGGEMSIITIDFFCKAILDSACNIDAAFTTLIEQGQRLAALPLLRIQLDNTLTAFAGIMAKNPDDFFLKFLSGNPINQIRSIDGNQMTNKYLIEELDKRIGHINDMTVAELYKKGCKFVHPSSVLIKASWYLQKQGSFQFKNWKESQPFDYEEGDMILDMFITEHYLYQVMDKWRDIKLANIKVYKGEALPDNSINRSNDEEYAKKLLDELTKR